MLYESGRDHHAPLAVELGLGGAGEEETLHPAALLAERVELGEPRLDERVPGLAAIGEETAVHPACEHDPGGERRAETSRQRAPVLVVPRVLVFSEQPLWGRAGGWPRHTLTPNHP